MSDTRKPVDRIAAWSKRTGYKPHTNVTNGLFVCSVPVSSGMLGVNSRDWRVARYNSSDKSVSLVTESFPLANSAKAAQRMMLAEKGISVTQDPTISLKGVPAFPINVLD